MHDAKSKLMECIEYLIDADHLANPPAQTFLRKLFGRSVHSDRDQKLSIARHLLGTTFVTSEPISLQDFWKTFGPGNSSFGTGPFDGAQRDKILSSWVSILRPEIPDSQDLVEITLQSIKSRSADSYRNGRENGLFVSIPAPRTLLIKELQNSLQLHDLRNNQVLDRKDKYRILRDEEMEAFGCDRCWPSSAKNAWIAKRSSKISAFLIDDPHYIVSIWVCEDCEQQFLNVTTEMVDFESGDDPIYRTFIPITQIELYTLTLSGRPDEALINSIGVGRRSLKYDWPKDQASTEYWGTGVLVGPHD